MSSVSLDAQWAFSADGESVVVDEVAVQEQVAELTENKEFDPEAIIVKYKDGTRARDIRELRSEADVDFVETIESPVGEKSELVEIDANTQTMEETLTELLSSPVVEYAEPDYIVYPEMTPNDPRFSDQWALNNSSNATADIDAAGAWDLTTGSSVVVAIIDTGAQISHPDLNDNLWMNPGELPGNGIDDDANGYVDDIHGWDFKNRDSSLFDSSSMDYHGTHVAGIVGAEGNNGIGISGVNHRAKLMILKALDSNGGTVSDIISAINYAASFGVRISNNSYGSYWYSQALKDAIANSGMLFVAAAGNEANNNNSSPFYPASYDLSNIISVAATTSSDRLASYSNYGTTSVDVGAPGSSILSTYPTSWYASLSGTSMAAPHVAGEASLLLTINPSLTVASLKSTILQAVDAIPTMQGKSVAGGRVNARTAIAAITDAPPTGLQCTQVGTGSIQCTWNKSIFETFRTVLQESPPETFYCDGATSPSCWIDGLNAGTYHVSVIATDTGTGTNKTTDAVTIDVVSPWVSPWTIADVAVEFRQGSVAASDVIPQLLTRWGINAFYRYRQEDPNGRISALVTLPSNYAYPYAEVMARTCYGSTSAPYTLALDGIPLVTFASGIDEDTTWKNGAVQMDFDFQEYWPWHVDYCGVTHVRIPRAILTPGFAHVLSMYANSDGGSWDWASIIDAPAGVVGVENATEKVSAIAGPNCQWFPSLTGPYRGCFSRSFVPQNQHTITVQMTANDLKHVYPSATLLSAEGIQFGQFDILLNGQLLGTFDTGYWYNRLWRFGNASLWWLPDKYCPCGTDRNGWLTLSAKRQLWQQGANTITIRAAGPYNVPWSWSTWSMAFENSFARELQYPNEGFASFNPESTWCETLPSIWGSVASCRAKMVDGAPPISFTTPALTAKGGEHVAFSWLGGSGTSTGTFTVAVNGTTIATINNNSIADRSWLSGDGQSRVFYTHIRTLPPDRNGVYTIVVPQTIAPVGVPAVVTITPASGTSADAWMAVFGFTETERERNTVGQ